MTCSDREPLLTPGFFLALLAVLVFFIWFAQRLVDDRWEYCKDLHPRNKWKQEHCYIEGFNHGTAKKN
jgi:hypothetical protein